MEEPDYRALLILWSQPKRGQQQAIRALTSLNSVRQVCYLMAWQRSAPSGFTSTSQNTSGSWRRMQLGSGSSAFGVRILEEFKSVREMQ